MNNTVNLRGITTLSFYADDVAAAAAWYSQLLGVEPYFKRPIEGPPAYVEFRLGDYQHELGIINRNYAPKDAANHGGAVVYWHVDDLSAAMETAMAMGASEYEPITPRGEGFITASVIDPFGNILGLMHNQHYLDVLAGKK